MSKKKLIYKVIVTVFCFIIVSGGVLFFQPLKDLNIQKKNNELNKSDSPIISEKNDSPQIPVKDTVTEPVIIRILIKNKDSYYHENVSLSSASEWTLNAQPHASDEAVEIGMESEQFSEDTVSASSASGITISSVERTQGVPTYPGEIKLYRSDLGILVINEVDLETYLKYVVPSEMPSSYEIEALKAQAVCARTYAYRNILDQGLAEYNADVDDSISFQVYNNLAPQESTDEAVRETSGEILTCEGEAITAYFFSTSCGHTSTDEVWNSSEGQSYLKSIYMNEEEDRSLETEEAFSSFISNNNEETYEQGEKWYRWQVYLSEEYLNQRIQDKHPSLGSFINMEVQKRSSGGAVEELLITGSSQTLLITNEYDIREFLSPGDNPISTNDGESSHMSGLLPSAYFICNLDYTPEGAPAGVQLTGGGYGHGVGLSQNGANNLAKDSKAYNEILNFFYQNIQIERLGA